MGLDISKTRFKSLKIIKPNKLDHVDISTIKADLLEEIACYYALKHQLKVISLNNSCYFCFDCKEKEYNFQLSLVSQLSLSENLKLEILIQNQEVILSNDINYLNQRLSYFRSKNIQKQNKITDYIAKYYNTNRICSGCGQ